MTNIKNTEITKGDTKIYNVTVLLPNKKVKDLTDYAGKLTVKQNLTDSDSSALISKSAIISEPTTGKLSFSLTNSDTDIPVGVYYYDIQITDGATDVKTLFKGTFTVTYQVTETSY
jgi:hypothetical protein